MARVRFGVLLPGIRPDLAQLAEQRGLDSVWVSEHVLFHVPLTEALSVVAAYAAVTERIRVGTAVFLLALRHPTVVAKTATTVDLISRGRLTLGVGVGGEYAKEFEACGVDVHERGRRVDESIVVMRRLWRESNVTHKGRFFGFTDVTMEPRPAQPGGPPVWVGGRSQAAERRAGSLGDGYLPYLFTPERFAEAYGRVQAIAREAGRDASAIEPALYLFTAIRSARAEARAFAVSELGRRYNQSFETLVDKYCAVGTPAECAAFISRFVEAGVRHVVLVPLSPEERLTRDIEALAAEVVPAARAAVPE